MIKAIQNIKLDISKEEIENYEEEYEFTIRTDTHIDTAITFVKCTELIRYLREKHKELEDLVQAFQKHYELELIVKQYLNQPFLTTSYEIRITDYLRKHGNEINTLIRFVKKLKSEEHTSTQEKLK